MFDMTHSSRLGKWIKAGMAAMTMLAVTACDVPVTNTRGYTDVTVSLAQTVAQNDMSGSDRVQLARQSAGWVLAQLIREARAAAAVSEVYPGLSHIALQVFGDGYTTGGINEDFNNNDFEVIQVLDGDGNEVDALRILETEFTISVPSDADLTFVVQAFNPGGYRVFSATADVTRDQLAAPDLELPMGLAVDVESRVPRLAGDSGCSGDDDGDGICNDFEDLFVNASGVPDIDGDGERNSSDLDADGDDVPDGEDGLTPSNDGFPAFVHANRPPVAVDDGYNTDEDTVLITGNVLVNDSDPDVGDALAIMSFDDSATQGMVTDNGDGTFDYTPPADFNGADSFTYTVSDNFGAVATATVNITVNPVNDAPVGEPDTYSVDEGGTLTIDAASGVLINDSDTENDPLNAILVSGVSHGALTLNADGSFVYTHDGSETTMDSFSYMPNDGAVDGNVVIVDIEINPVNDPPVGAAESYTVNEGGTLTVAKAGGVLSNDSDAENDSLMAVLVSGVSHGTLTLNADGSFTYVHDGSETTSDSFSYKPNDRTADGNVVTVGITINPVNDAPVAEPDAYSVDEGGTLTVAKASGVLNNDSDAENDPLSAILVSGVSNGTLSLNADGSFTYVHDGSETTSDSFSYKPFDGTDYGNVVTVSITINPVNDAPVGEPDTYSVDEGGTLTVSPAGGLLLNDSDAENDSLSVMPVGNASNGTLTLREDGSFTYKHDGSETTSDSFSYKPFDGTDYGDVVTVNITINPVNDAPVGEPDDYSVDEGGTLTVAKASGVLSNDSDAENDPLSAILVSGVSNGTLTLSDDGSFTYVHDGSETTSDSFSYKPNDGTADGAVVTVGITVNPVNDAPVISGTPATAVPVGLPYEFTPQVSDAEGDALTFSITNPPAWASFDVATGSLGGTPSDTDEGTTAGIVITVTDSQGASTSLPAFDLAVVSVDGVRRVTFSVTGSNATTSGSGSCFDREGPPSPGETWSDYVSVQQVNDVLYLYTIYGTPMTGFIGSDGGFIASVGEVYTDPNGWEVTETMEFQGQIDPADMAVKNASFSNQLVKTDPNNSDNTATCTIQGVMAGDFVYRHSGTENYNGRYGLEGQADAPSAGSTGRYFADTIEVYFNDSTGQPVQVYLADDRGATVTASSFNPAAGAFNVELGQTQEEDRNGDGAPDLVCGALRVIGLLVRAPDDASGKPTLSLGFEDEEKVFYGNATSTPSDCSATPDEFQSGHGMAYGRGLNIVPATRRILDADGGGTTYERHLIGWLNPPLNHFDPLSTLTLEVRDATGTNLLCSRTYDAGYRSIDMLDHIPDFVNETFQGEVYGAIFCDTYQDGQGTALVDGAQYQLKVVDDRGTPTDSSDDLGFGPVTVTADLAALPAERLNRREVDLNGVKSSSTEAGNPIGLYGFYNPYQPMLAAWPGVTDTSNLKDYMLVFRDLNDGTYQRRMRSAATGNVLIPEGAIGEDDQGTVVNLWARYEDANGKVALSRSRKLLVKPGVNGIFNIETDFIGSALGALQIQMLTEGDTVECVVTNSDAVSCGGGVGVPGVNPAAIDWQTSRVALVLYDIDGQFTGTPGAGFPVLLTFTDSGKADVEMVLDPNGTIGSAQNAFGVARMVNPELKARSRIFGSNAGNGAVYQTLVPLQNPMAFYNVATLESLNGNLIDELSSSSVVTLWDNTDSDVANDFPAVIGSYRQLPLDDGKAQRVGIYRVFKGPQAELPEYLLPADTYRVVLSQDMHGGPDKVFKVDYASPDPTAYVAPMPDQITVNGIPGPSVPDPLNPVDVGADPLLVTWQNPGNVPTGDIRWMVRIREIDTTTGSPIPHAQVRTGALELGVDADLSYDATTGIWTWTGSADVVLPNQGEVFALQIRAYDPDGTLQGDSEAVFITNTSP